MSKTIPVELFFNFFSPPVTPDDGDFIEKVELDYQLGEYFKDKLVRSAIFWFTGETLDSSEYDSDGDTGSDSENEVESY
jgi:nucleosome assembly protein 1-like 1